MPKTVGLTAKEERFIAEYLSDANAARSALAAGYSPKTATRIGSHLLARPRVKAAIKALQTKLLKKLDLTAEKVLADIERIANKAERSRQFNAAIRGKQLLGQHLKLFTEKHEHGGIGGGPVMFQITEKEADL